MNESKEKILQMLQDGSITAEEADRLLLAVGNTEWEDTDGGGENEESPCPKSIWTTCYCPMLHLLNYRPTLKACETPGRRHLMRRWHWWPRSSFYQWH